MTPRGGLVRLSVRVQPRASRDEVAGRQGDAVRIRLQAPPVDGAANEALVAFLASHLGIARRQVRLVAGLSSRNKVVEIEGADPSALDRLRSGT